jgi:mannose-6-phosphate isomerase
VVQHYDWGDTSFLPRFLGTEPDGRPWAELWLGTHPNGPSLLDDGRPLSEVTGELPYLLKVLSAARPLSLQTHPNREQAVRGHAEGRYPDPNPKPELLCALTPFEALCGVRPVDTTLELLADLGIVDLAEVLRDGGPGAVLTALYRGTLDPSAVISACSDHERPEAAWVRRLDAMYPGQPSVAVTLLLNHVVLEPGEAIHLGAGNLHAYLSGSGIELMGASDNVVRGGLTTKHVDIDDLLAVVDPTPVSDPRLRSADRYPLADVGVELRRVAAGSFHRSTSHELAVELDGSTWYLPPGTRFEPETTAFVVTATTATPTT